MVNIHKLNEINECNKKLSYIILLFTIVNITVILCAFYLFKPRDITNLSEFTFTIDYLMTYSKFNILDQVFISACVKSLNRELTIIHRKYIVSILCLSTLFIFTSLSQVHYCIIKYKYRIILNNLVKVAVAPNITSILTFTEIKDITSPTIRVDDIIILDCANPMLVGCDWVNHYKNGISPNSIGSDTV
jgi:hypothetical protein